MIEDIDPNKNCVNPPHARDVDVLRTIDFFQYGSIGITLMRSDLKKINYVHLNDSEKNGSVIIKEVDLLDFLGVEEE